MSNDLYDLIIEFVVTRCGTDLLIKMQYDGTTKELVDEVLNKNKAKLTPCNLCLIWQAAFVVVMKPALNWAWDHIGYSDEACKCDVCKSLEEVK